MDKTLIASVILGLILAGICLAIWKVMLNPRFRSPHMGLFDEIFERYLK